MKFFLDALVREFRFEFQSPQETTGWLEHIQDVIGQKYIANQNSHLSRAVLDSISGVELTNIPRLLVREGKVTWLTKTKKKIPAYLMLFNDLLLLLNPAKKPYALYHEIVLIPPNVYKNRGITFTAQSGTSTFTFDVLSEEDKLNWTNSIETIISENAQTALTRQALNNIALPSSQEYINSAGGSGTSSPMHLSANPSETSSVESSSDPVTGAPLNNNVAYLQSVIGQQQEQILQLNQSVNQLRSLVESLSNAFQVLPNGGVQRKSSSLLQNT